MIALEIKQPIIRKDKFTKDEQKKEHAKVYACPNCDKFILGTYNGSAAGYKDNFCRDCGQGLDWADIDIETYFPM